MVLDTRKFHEKYFEHLKCNAEDVAKVIATDSNNEKWFQGEMAICFSSMPNYKIISSLEYNERETKPKDLDNWWGDHIEGTSFGIVTTEAQIYKKGPKKGYGKCDFILHTDDDFLATEIKVLWIYDDLDKDDIKKRFKDNNVYRDIRRLRNNLYKEYKKRHMFL